MARSSLRTNLCFIAKILILVSVGGGELLAQVPLVYPSLQPPSTKPRRGGFVLKVGGTGFSRRAVVEWNGSARTTEFISRSVLKATINATDVAHAGTASVRVVNPGGKASNVVFFPVRKQSSAFTFAQKLVFPGSVGVVAGDFNNDGLLDVAWGTPDSLYVSLGDGKGGFQAPIASSGSGARVLAADFNNDGNLDLAVDTGSAVNVYVGDGHGHLTFASQPIGDGGGIAIADFNGDGNLDIYTTGHGTFVSWFSISLGNGDGSFGSTANYSTREIAAFPAVGDFNGDGWLDLVVPEQGIAEVFLGNAGVFGSGVSQGFLRLLPIAVGMNEDGKLDILDLCVLLGQGDGTFTEGGCPQTQGIAQVAVGDFDGDGHLDSVMSFPLTLALGDGKGGFKEALQFAAGLGTDPGAVGDFNGDGRLDLVTNDGYLLLQTTVGLAPLALAFGDQKVKTTSPPQTATLTNMAKKALKIQHIGINGSNRRDFVQTNNCGLSLPGGASCQIQVTFRPLQQGARSAALAVSYLGVGSPQTVALSGNGIASPTVSLEPSKLSFATRLIHTKSKARIATLTNTGDTDVHLSGIQTTGPFPQTNNCPQTLSVNTACQISVQFAPITRGLASGKLFVNDDAQGSPQTVALSGEGTVVRVSPQEINFADQKVGTQSPPVPVIVMNLDDNPVTISQIAIGGADSTDFLAQSECGTSIPPHGHCTVNVTFQPTQQGQRSASLDIYDDGGGSPQKVTLLGNGT